MNKRFLEANIGNVVAIVVGIVTYIYYKKAGSIAPIVLIILCYIDIWLFKIAFEYQRITLIISRIAKLNKSQFVIPDLQVMMTSGTFGFFLFLTSFLTGYIVGYLLSKMVILLLLFLVVKYLLNMIVPGYIPYRKLFFVIGKEINNRDMGLPGEYIEKVRLNKYFEELPHDKTYEDSAFKKYGNVLLSVK